MKKKRPETEPKLTWAEIKDNKPIGLFIIANIYALASVLGILLFNAWPDMHFIWRIAIAAAAATVFVYLTGLIFQNASVYDPYWSVAPLVVFSGFAVHVGVVSQGTPLLLLAVWFWGLRLTRNWAYTFKNLATQDWRYDNFKQRFPRLYPIISLFGIHLFPTLVVYLCMLPGIALMQNYFFNIFTVLGFAVCVGATILQLIADRQMYQFRRKDKDRQGIIRVGLWKHARHPNYLGEILMWWGVYGMMLSVAPRLWFLGLGALVNTLMFLFISIPMADKRNRANKPGFAEYVRETNHLLPFRLKRQVKGSRGQGAGDRDQETAPDPAVSALPFLPPDL
ncbi:MAG: DUF1295 domain-containing protein [Clostridiales bacterium]|nr:DUF1295 domain-containing protein [Clostridiales bacterium]